MTTPLPLILKARALDVFEFLARVLTQIPQPRKHGAHYMGAYWHRPIGANGDSLEDQLTRFNGGCAVRCTTVQAAIHLP